MTCTKSFSITVDPASVCAVSLGNIPYVTLPGTVFLNEIVASTDNANRAMALGIDPGPTDYWTAFIDTTTDTEIVSINEGAVVHGNGVTYAVVNQTFWFIILNGPTYNMIYKYSKDGAFLGSFSIVAANVANATGNVNGYIAYEPNTALIYAFPDSDGFGGNDDLMLMYNPTTNGISTQVLTAGPLLSTGGHVLSCPGKLFVTGVSGLLANQFNIYNVPGFALVATIDLNATGWQGGFAFAANTGKVYFASASASQIFEINPNNATVDFTYNLGTVEVNAIVYDPIQGRLIAYDFAGNVFTIDPANRTVICTETTIPGGVTPYEGAALDTNLGKVYANLSGAFATTEIWQ